MPTIKRFEDLPVWNAATDLSVAVFKLTEAPSFRFKGDLVNQLRRAALSVANNVAEGFERGSTAELISFLYIARGSAGEVRSMLRFALRLGEMQDQTERINSLIPQCEAVSRQLRAWLDSLQNSDIKGQRHLNDQTREAWKEDKKRAEISQVLAAYRAAMEQQLRDGIYGTPDAPPIPDPFSPAGFDFYLSQTRNRKLRPKTSAHSASPSSTGASHSPTSTSPSTTMASPFPTSALPSTSVTSPSTSATSPSQNPVSAPQCPKCGATMLRRKSRAGVEFWGCSAYPKCSGSRKIDP